MTTLLNIALINALTVLPLAVLAFLVSRWARRPALTHALWVLVLLKFVTPPLFNLPVTIEMPQAAEPQVRSARQGDAGVPRNGTPTLADDQPHSVGGFLRNPLPVSEKPAYTDGPLPTVMPEVRPTYFAAAMRSIARAWSQRPGLASLLLVGWLAGAVFWTTLQIVRTIRFRRIIRYAVASGELQEQTRQLADRLGLRRAPQVLTIDAAVSPMLWGCGSRARLLFPVDLAKRLDENARATLLTHELAHFGRGDHWVRLLELVATGLFWWHPVVWLARRQIEEAEEECCDAWVVGEFPHAPRQYADALLDTIDFLCESRRALPPVASGLGQAHFLRHRLTKIMRGAAPKALSTRVRCAIALVAALLLPLQPFVFGSSKIVGLPLASLEELAADDGSPNESGPMTPAGESAGDSASAASPPPEAPDASSPSRTRIPGERVWSTAVSPGGGFVVRTTTARRVLLTDRKNNSETDLSAQGITAVAFAPDGEWFAAAGQDGRLTIWDSARGEMLRTVLTHGDVLRSVAVSPQGDRVAAGSRDGSVLLNDFVTGEPLASLSSFASAVNCVRFSSDGQQLAVAVGDWTSHGRGAVALLSAASGETIASLDCAAAPGALTFASKDELIVGLWDGRTQLWNLVNRQVVGSADADKNVVAAAAFSPDNPVLREVTFVAAEPSLP